MAGEPRPPPAPQRSELSQSGMTGIEGYMGGIDAIRDAGVEREVREERYQSAVADYVEKRARCEASILARDKMLQELEARLRHRQRYPDTDGSSVMSTSQSPNQLLMASRREESRVVSDTTGDMTGSTLESGEPIVRPTVPLLFDSSRHPLPVSVQRTGMADGQGASARSGGSGNVPRGSFTPGRDSKRGDNTITRQTRAAEVSKKQQVQVYRSGPAGRANGAADSDDGSDKGSSSDLDWPFILGAAGVGVLLGGGLGWLCTHSMYAGTAKLAPAGVQNVTVGAGAGPPVPWSVAAAGANSAGHTAGSQAAADVMLKAAAAGGAKGKAVGDATAAGATAAAAAASKSLTGATAAALATPFVVPAIPMPYLAAAGAGSATLITGAAVGSGLGAVTGGGAGWAIQRGM